MQFGFQVFDDVTGALIFDLASRAGRVLGVRRINAGESGSLTLPEDVSGVVFASFQRDMSIIAGVSGQNIPSVPVFRVNGRVITWISKTNFTTWLGNNVYVQPVGGWLTYGVY